VAIDVVVVVIGLVLTSSPFRGASTQPFISKGVRGYKEGNGVGYNMIPIRTLSLLAYFTYIFIDIIIYTLGSMSWPSGIFWMVGQVIARPSLGLLSQYRVVPGYQSSSTTPECLASE
jgi:hypothetical protein